MLLQGFALEASGFGTAVRVEGGQGVRPLLQVSWTALFVLPCRQHQPAFTAAVAMCCAMEVYNLYSLKVKPTKAVL